MNPKKIGKIALLLIAILLLAGCGKENETTTKNTQEKKTSEPSINNKTEVPESQTEGMSKLTCTREADAGSDIDVNLDYEVYYQGEYIQILHSTEQVVTDNQETLDEYENAYHSIYLNYQDLDYYDTAIIRTSNSVTNDTVINYGKIDTDKLLEIEGEEDNVIKDGKVKLQDWLDFAEQFGTTCEE